MVLEAFETTQYSLAASNHAGFVGPAWSDSGMESLVEEAVRPRYT